MKDAPHPGRPLPSRPVFDLCEEDRAHDAPLSYDRCSLCHYFLPPPHCHRCSKSCAPPKALRRRVVSRSMEELQARWRAKEIPSRRTNATNPAASISFPDPTELREIRIYSQPTARSILWGGERRNRLDTRGNFPLPAHRRRRRDSQHPGATRSGGDRPALAVPSISQTLGGGPALRSNQILRAYSLTGMSRRERNGEACGTLDSFFSSLLFSSLSLSFLALCVRKRLGFVSCGLARVWLPS